VLEEFGDLNGIESGAFADLVADDPEVECVFEDEVFADAADEAFVLAGGVEGDGEDFVRWVIDDMDAGFSGVCGACGIGIDGV
jgi:hypothetical protein